MLLPVFMVENGSSPCSYHADLWCDSRALREVRDALLRGDAVFADEYTGSYVELYPISILLAGDLSSLLSVALGGFADEVMRFGYNFKA